MIEILITKRSHDWHACLAVDHGFWGCGRSPEEAIGDLMRSHPERFNVSISEHRR